MHPIFGIGQQDHTHTDAKHMHTRKHINAFYEFGLSLCLVAQPEKLCSSWFWLTQSISVKASLPSLCARWSLTKWTWGLKFYGLNGVSSQGRQTLWEVLKTTSKHFFSCSFATHLCLIFLTSLAKCLSVGPPCSTWKVSEKGRVRDSAGDNIWILITARSELAGVMRKIYKTVSSFCRLTFSVKKIDGFIMLLHCVHVWVYSTACQSGTVPDMFWEAIR